MNDGVYKKRISESYFSNNNLVLSLFRNERISFYDQVYGHVLYEYHMDISALMH